MRMWKVPVEMLCNQHLLGEHVEMHMFNGTIRARKSIDGFVNKGLLETHYIGKRHDELVREMTKRGMNHYTPLHQPRVEPRGSIDVDGNIIELTTRCDECRKRIKALLNKQ